MAGEKGQWILRREAGHALASHYVDAAGTSGLFRQTSMSLRSTCNHENAGCALSAVAKQQPCVFGSSERQKK